MATLNRIFDILDLYKSDYFVKEDALAYKINDKWIKYSSSVYIYYANRISLGLLNMGIEKNDTVATIMNNRPEFNYIDMGLQQIGAIHVPIYPTISESNYKYILNDAGIKVIFISDKLIYQKIKPILKDTNVQQVFSIEEVNEIKSWREVVNLGKLNEKAFQLETIKKNISENDIATIIYTSGTTGTPKGVMLTHKNLISNINEVSTIPKFNINHKILSFLPLSHVYERIINYTFQYLGSSIYYAESIEKLSTNMQEVKPDAFSAVPRVLEKAFEKIMNKGRSLHGIKRILFFWAIKLGERYDVDKAHHLWYQLQLYFANLLIFKQWRKAFGGNVKLIVSGGATIPDKVARLFWAAKIKVMVGYGLTETSPVIAVTDLSQGGFRFNTVGRVLKNIEVKFAEDGEILVKGPSVMLGYYKQPERTLKVFDEDGWFRTGDIGFLDKDRFLTITDRKKEIFKTSGGKYIAPQIIEHKLCTSEFIEHAMVVGENQKFAAALIIPNFEMLKAWCAVKAYVYKTKATAIHDELIIDKISREINLINTTLDKTEQIKKFVLIDHDWTVDGGELSPTLKLRRKFINQKYQEQICSIYSENN